MNNSSKWQRYAEGIKSELSKSDIKCDKVEVVQNNSDTILKIVGVDVSGEGESKENASFYGLPEDPGEAAALIIQYLTDDQKQPKPSG